MKKIELRSEITEYDSENELSPEDRKLLKQARRAALAAYAPYSQFRVGAAVALESGLMVTGNNQENAAYPSGLCAERVALFAASAQHPGMKFKAIAVACCKGRDEPVTPCGGCRQVLHEYERMHGSEIKMILAGEKGKVWVVKRAGDLLPLAFDSAKLKQGK